MKARTAAWILIGATAVAIAAVMFGRQLNVHTPHVDIDPAVYPVRGIDISAHNGAVDFDSVAADGISFIYIKASEGATWRDARFEDNYRAARRAGLAVGAYHFFRFDVVGWKQGLNLLSTLRGADLDLPVAIDIEESGNPTEYSTDEIIENVADMISLLDRAGRPAIIYTNKNGYVRFVRNHFDDVPLWICSFTDPPIAERGRWTVWQHSHMGRVSGVAGPVDLNTVNTPASKSPFLNPGHCLR